MTHTTVTYKRPTSREKTYTDWKWRAGNKFFKQTDRKKSRGTNTLFRQNRLEKRAIKRDPEGHFIILQGRIHQEDINIVNIYAPNIGAPKYIKKILEDFKKDIDSNTIIVGDFNTTLSKMDRSSKQNIKKDIVSLNNTLEEMDLKDIYRAFHPKEAKYTFFPSACGKFSKIDHMMGHKTSLKNSRKLKSYQAFSLTTRDWN